ncbi:MAG: hypothetical protein IJQ50_01645, partial [Clostridia bacterium]|nr:hypothetical protein [Clostridia bacterium]
DNTTLAKALNIRLANLGIGKQKTVYDMVVKIGGESVITGTNTTSTVLNDTSTLLYDLDDNKFFTVDKDGKVDYDGRLSLSDELNEAYKYWIFANSVDTTYSTYLLSGSTLTSATVSTGIDVGYKTDVTSITYTNPGSAQTVVIRTNSASTELVVNAQYDTVKHYDAVGQVHVIAVDKNNCYEENGKAAFTQVDSGKYKTSATADVNLLFVSNSSNVTLEIAKGTVKHAHAISEAEANTINLTNPGVIFDYDGNNAQSTLNVYHHVNDGDKMGLTTDYSVNKAKDAVIEVVNEAVENTVFAGVSVSKTGEATQLMTLEAFRDSVNAGTDYAGYTVTLLDNIDLNGIEWTPIGTTEHPFSGVFDGQNYTIKNYKIRGTGENVGLALFGCIKGTASTLTSTTNLSEFYNTTNYTVNLPAEEIFTCVVKNLNVSGADVSTTADGWTAAVVAYVEDATISNIRLSNSTITAEQKVGGIAGFLPSDYACYITNCTTSSDVTVTASTGNHSAGILARVDTDKSRGIIANCTNNATISCAGVNGGGIAGQAKNVLHYNNTNNGSVTGKTRAAGIATDCTGSIILNCTNNGYIKTTAVYSGANDSSAGIASYLAGNGNSVVVNCHNSGTIEGNAPKGDTIIAGIAGGSVHQDDKIINNSNTGTLINHAENGKAYDICNLSGVANEVTPSDLSGLNSETAKDNKYIKVNSSLVLSENNNTVTFNGQEKLEFVNSPAYLTLDLSGANKSSFVLMVNDTVVTLKNGGDNYVTISGKGNTVKVEDEDDVKSLTVLNDDTQSASSFNILGNATNLVLKGNGLVNGEIAENATAERVVFSGNGTFTLTNRGTISHKTEGQYGAEHTIDTITASNITIYNYGTIEAKINESDVASYALLFYGGATVKLYAYNGSNIIAEGNKSVIVTSGGTQVNVYYQDGAEVTYYDSQSTYPKAFGYYCTVTKMN